MTKSSARGTPKSIFERRSRTGDFGSGQGEDLKKTMRRFGRKQKTEKRNNTISSKEKQFIIFGNFLEQRTTRTSVANTLARTRKTMHRNKTQIL